MMKSNNSGDFFTIASRLLVRCLVVVAIGPICHTSDAVPTVTPVMSNFTHADSPFWDGGNLVFVDAYDKKIFKYQPASPVALSAELDAVGDLAFLVPIKTDPNKFAVGAGNIVNVFIWDGTSSLGKPAIKAEKFLIIDESGTVMCGKADAAGRLLVGTSYGISDGTLRGRFYSADKSGKVILKLDNIGVPTGLTWSPDNTQLYYSDSTDNKIVAISYEPNTGNIVGAGRDILKLASQNINLPSMANGMTVDTRGFLWVAVWKQAFVWQIEPSNGTIVSTVDFKDTDSISSVTFGGSTLDDMFVTTVSTLESVTGTGAKGIGVYELEEAWPMNPPPS